MQTKLEKYKKTAIEKQQIVSVFMLTYNREHYVKLAIDGVLSQTYQNFQLIVLDNCSKDNTEQVITSIPDERLTYIKRAHTPDCPNALLALKTCVTKYLIILHDDDIVNPNYLEEMLEVMEKENLTVATAGATIIDGDGVPYAEHLWKDRSEIVVFRGNDYISSFLRPEHISMTYPSAVYRCDFYKEFENFAGNPEVGPAGDQWIWFETERLGGTMGFVNRPLFQYRVHRVQESKTYAGKMELMLMDYLLTKPYYQQVLMEHWQAVAQVIWIAYRALSKKYYCRQIALDQYKEVFNHRCVKELKDNSQSRSVYAKLILSYHMRGLLRILLKLIGKI